MKLITLMVGILAAAWIAWEKTKSLLAPLLIVGAAAVWLDKSFKNAFSNAPSKTPTGDLPGAINGAVKFGM